MQKKHFDERLLVLPTTRAIREYVNSQKSSNRFLDKTITIGDFLSCVVFSKDYKKLCEKNLRTIFLKQAIEQNELQTLGFSSELSTFLKQSEYIFRFFNELVNEYVEFDTLLEVDTYTLYSDHLEVLKAIYKRYIEILDQNNYTDKILLPNNYSINKEYLKEYSSILIELEGYPSKFEFKVLQEAASVVPLSIRITINEFNQKNKTLFSFLEDELEVGYKYNISLTNKTVINKQALSQKETKLVITSTSSTLEQIGFIKEQIVTMCNDGINPEKIALVVPDESIASSLELFDTEHYFNFAMGRSIKDSSIVKITGLINKLSVDPEPKDVAKFKFYSLGEKEFIELFQMNWNKQIDQANFNLIMEYLISFESKEEILEKLEQLKISLEILLFGSDSELVVTTKEFMKILYNQLLQITVDDVHGGKITVLGILETRAIEFDGVIVCDFNDDTIPKRSVKDKFLSTKIKELAKLPTLKDRENLQKYYYKMLFDKAKSIALCFVEDDSSVMSRFILQLFPNYKEKRVEKNYKSILYTPSKLQPYHEEVILDIDLSRQSWSATKLKTYLTCKRKFYFNYIAKIKDHELSLKPKSFEVGDIIHKALEKALKEDCLSEEFLSNFFADYQKNNPYLTLELELWKRKLNTFIMLESLRKDNGIKTVALEEPFEITYQGVNLVGTIDRVDKLPDGTLEILDYKTSSSLKVDSAKTYEKANDFQLEFYYLAKKAENVSGVAYYDLYDLKVKDELMLEKKLELLDKYLSNLYTVKVDFSCTEELSNCQFCSYKTICGREY